MRMHSLAASHLQANTEEQTRQLAVAACMARCIYWQSCQICSINNVTCPHAWQASKFEGVEHPRHPCMPPSRDNYKTQHCKLTLFRCTVDAILSPWEYCDRLS